MSQNHTTERDSRKNDSDCEPEGQSDHPVDYTSRFSRLDGQICKSLGSLTNLYKRYHYVWTATGILLLAAIVYALFTRVDYTQIEVQTQVSGFGFEPSSPTSESSAIDLPVVENLQLTELGIQGEFLLDTARLSKESTLHKALGGQLDSLRLWTGDTACQSGRLDIETIHVPVGTTHWLEHDQRSSITRWQSVRGMRHLKVDLRGDVCIAAPGKGRAVISSRIPKPIIVTFNDAADQRQPSVLEFRTQRAGPLFVTRFPIRALRFTRADIHEGEMLWSRTISTIHSGDLFLDDAGGRHVSLRAAENLRFGTTHGVLRQVALKDGAFTLQFSGSASGASTGPDGSRRPLMPFRGEVFIKQEKFDVLEDILVLASIFFGTLFAAVRHAAKRREKNNQSNEA